MMEKSHIKRAVKDEPIFLDAELFNDLLRLVDKVKWNYKTNRELYARRDKALFCFLILSGCRVSEALILKKKQFRVYPNKIEVANVQTLKHGLLREKIFLPKLGSLKPFTYIFEDWLQTVPEDSNYIFPLGNSTGLNYKLHIGRKRAFEIVALTGKFPHWARAVCANIYGKIVFKNDAWKLKEFMGWKNLDSSSSYVNGRWEEDEKRIFML